MRCTYGALHALSVRQYIYMSLLLLLFFDPATLARCTTATATAQPSICTSISQWWYGTLSLRDFGADLIGTALAAAGIAALQHSPAAAATDGASSSTDAAVHPWLLLPKLWRGGGNGPAYVMLSPLSTAPAAASADIEMGAAAAQH